MSRICLLCALLLAACTEPRLGLSIGIGPGGVAVHPRVSGSVGGVDVGVSGAIR
jgi:hypothetical protein